METVRRAFFFTCIALPGVACHRSESARMLQDHRGAECLVLNLNYPAGQEVNWKFTYGSGVAVDEEGYVLTVGHMFGGDGNDHVRVNCSKADNERAASVIEVNRPMNLALLKVEQHFPHPAALSRTPLSEHWGEWVYMIGYTPRELQSVGGVIIDRAHWPKTFPAPGSNDDFTVVGDKSETAASGGWGVYDRHDGTLRALTTGINLMPGGAGGWRINIIIPARAGVELLERHHPRRS